MKSNTINNLQEIYLLEDTEFFFVGIPLNSIGNWDAYVTFDETGENSSIYLFNRDMISEIITQSPYLDFLKFAIQRKNRAGDIINSEQRKLLTNREKIERVLTENQVLGIGIDNNDRFLGKITSLTPSGICLQEFDFNTCQLVKEDLNFMFSEIAHIELFSERTKLITEYLKMH